MNLTLRAARRLEQEIATFLAKKVKTGINVSIHLEVNSHDDIATLVNVQKTQERIDLHRKLLNVRYNIRRRIQKANEQGDVNEIIAKRKHALCVRDFLTELVSQSERYFENVGNLVSLDEYSPSTLFNNICSLRHYQGKETFSGPKQHVEVPAITHELFLLMKADIRKLNKQVQGFDEELLRLNTSCFVELYDVEKSYLSQAEIEV